jgi:EAL and modified HD-GYP domain-containing signal transduction protein
MQCFVARQPVLDRHLNVIAYELLFRSGFENFYRSLDDDRASSDVLTASFILFGLEGLTRGKKASINFTRRLLIEEAATLFPKDLLIIEILENVEPDQEIIPICRNLKEAGYMLALDDFVHSDLNNPLLEFADIVKVDFRRTRPEERRAIPTEIDSGRIALLAEKVETYEQFNQASDWGYSYFQGFFLSKPIMHSDRVIPGSKLSYLRLLNELHKTEVNFDRVDQIIKQDLSLSYRLLKFINSAYFSLIGRIRSTRHALTMLGVAETKKWISLAALSGLATDRPDVLLINSLTRARFCEQLALTIGETKMSPEFFLMGMFSLIDAIMEKPMGELLTDLPLIEEIKLSLMGGDNILRDALEVFLSYERADWHSFSRIASKIDLDESDVPQIYHSSVAWVNQVLEVAEPVGHGI